jgi:hypothetical protein
MAEDTPKKKERKKERKTERKKNIDVVSRTAAWAIIM